MGESLTVRSALSQDVEAMLSLAEVRRGQYAVYQPVFWQPASDAVERQRRYFEGLLADERVIAVVAVADSALRGFAVARLMGPPPVYDPGGETCMVDDFTVADPADWATVGVTLLRAVHRTALSRGAAQIVVVTAHLDEPRDPTVGLDGSLGRRPWRLPTSPTSTSRPDTATVLMTVRLPGRLQGRRPDHALEVA